MSTMMAEVVERLTHADVLQQLGGVSPSRILFRPAPGTATEDDVIKIHDRERRLFELIDGVLVEKVTGYWECVLAIEWRASWGALSVAGTWARSPAKRDATVVSGHPRLAAKGETPPCERGPTFHPTARSDQTAGCDTSRCCALDRRLFSCILIPISYKSE
jgi:hypothetical protein